MKTKKIQRVALVGGGVIGSGWATRCLAHGLSVVVTDPSPAAAEMVLKTVDSAWPILEQAGLDEKADRSKLEFVPDIKTAVAGADFVQENVPEREDLKIVVHEEIGLHTEDDIVVASSSSEISPSGTACRSSGGSSCRMFSNVCRTVRPRNGSRNASDSYSTTPSEYMSDASDTDPPFACSGDRYWAVPRIDPTSVISEPAARAIPKSITFTLSASSIITF